jgi:anthranilate/para-aminobenzoate synthase component I
VEGSAFALYAQAFGRALVPFGFAVDWGTGHRIVGASPELCLEHRANGSLLTRPIKGTRPRGASSAEDEALARELATDPKERAELNMVVDLERNDLGRLSETGSVEVLSAGEVESYETVHHRVATIRSRVRRDVTREQLLRTFLPSGSVTGTPKLAAMRQIAHLEPERRGLYTGAIGYIAQDGGLRLAMAIRTMTVDRDGQAQYFAGGGIVADSQPEREVMETLWKTRQLCAGLVEGTTAPRGLAVDRSSEQTSVENWADWLSSSTDEGDSISGAAD